MFCAGVEEEVGSGKTERGPSRDQEVQLTHTHTHTHTHNTVCTSINQPLSLQLQKQRGSLRLSPAGSQVHSQLILRLRHEKRVSHSN